MTKTGFKDKKGKMILDSDKVLYQNAEWLVNLYEGEYELILFREDGVILETLELKSVAEKCEVIGNLYE